MIRYQRTIKNPVSCSGIGLHSGKPVHMTLLPAETDRGIVFVRTDLGRSEVKAAAANTAATNHATTLRNGRASIQTVEHLLAALSGLGISNLIIEIDGGEAPIMDGSAGPFLRVIVDAGIRTQNKVQPVLKVTRPLFLKDGDKEIAIWPSETPGISCFIDFDHPLVHEQSMSYTGSEENFIREVADARTFGFLKDVEALQASGLALGGSLENAVVLDGETVLNKEGLRFGDEFVRHKVLDIIGDLALAGMPIIGHVVARKSGHSLNAKLVAMVLQDPRNWVHVGDPSAAPRRREKAVYQQPAATL